jgi:hypothetical protein
MTAKELGQQPANAQPLGLDQRGMLTTTIDVDKSASGMTKREAFAMAAMQGLFHSHPDAAIDSRWFTEIMPKMAVSAADALINELARTQE